MSFHYSKLQAIVDRILLAYKRNLKLCNCELCGRIGQYMWNCESCGLQYDAETVVKGRYPQFIPYMIRENELQMVWNPNIIAAIYGWKPEDSHANCGNPGEIHRYSHKDAPSNAPGMEHHWSRHTSEQICQKSCYGEIYNRYWKKLNVRKEEIETFQKWASRTDLGEIYYEDLPKGKKQKKMNMSMMWIRVMKIRVMKIRRGRQFKRLT